MVNLFEQRLEEGRRLAEHWGDYVQSIEREDTRIATAMLLENQERHLQSMLAETTFTGAVAQLNKYALPVIRSVVPNLVANDLVSVQPMSGPTDTIFFLQFLYSQDKGNIVGGTPLESGVQKNYSGETIELETVSTAAVEVHCIDTLAYAPVRPGTVTITDGTQVARDNGAGRFVGDVAGGLDGTINYATGSFDFDFANNKGGLPTATYDYNQEADSYAGGVPQIDILMTSSPIIARDRRLRARWSSTATANLKTLHGLDADVELTSVISDELRAEVDKEIIDDMFRIASAGTVTFSATVPQYLSRAEYYQGFVNTLIEASNLVFTKLQRQAGNPFLICGTSMANIVEGMPQFQRTAAMPGRGITKIGTISGTWDVYKDPTRTTTGLVGYRGVSMLDTGYVYAPYIPLFVTPTILLDDFINRKGLATSYGKKVINSNFYALVSLT